MNQIVTYAFAKVNLLLNITKKLANGYHEMESIFVFLNDIYDKLIFSPDLEFNEFSAIIPEIKENSICKAAKILKANFDNKIPHVTIEKNLPIAAGIGGGSSDSACFINTVFDIWGFSLLQKIKYLEIFDELGADNKVFLYKYFYNCKSVYLKGTGLEGDIRCFNLGFDDHYILLINDGDQLSTKRVFEAFEGPFCESAKFPYLLENYHNSLERPAKNLLPKLNLILQDLEKTHPLIFGISGSGPSCFAIYNTQHEADLAMSHFNYKFVNKSRL